MKKTYINPNIVVVNIATQQMLAASPFDRDGSGNLRGGTLKDGNATGGAMGHDDDFDW
jgi:hypothetical protein